MYLKFWVGGKKEHKNFYLSYLSAFLTMLVQVLRRSYKKWMYRVYVYPPIFNISNILCSQKQIQKMYAIFFLKTKTFISVHLFS